MTTSTAASSSQADWRSPLARVGLVARGVLYMAIGYLAFQAASSGGSGQQASSGGVFQYLGGQPGGELMLGVLALGLVAYALWNFARAAWGDPVSGSETSDRVMYAVKGGLYVSVAFSAVAALMSSGGGSGGSGGSQQTAGFLLGLPGGAFLTGAIGVGIAVYGAKQIKDNGLDAEFMSKLSPDRFANERLVRRAGQIGYTARGATLIMIGGFFLVAALQHDPDEAKGLGGALATLSQQPYGQVLLYVAAAGLFLFGLYTVAEAKMRRAT